MKDPLIKDLEIIYLSLCLQMPSQQKQSGKRGTKWMWSWRMHWEYLMNYRHIKARAKRYERYRHTLKITEVCWCLTYAYALIKLLMQNHHFTVCTFAQKWVEGIILVALKSHLAACSYDLNFSALLNHASVWVSVSVIDTLVATDTVAIRIQLPWNGIFCRIKVNIYFF